MVDSVGMSTTEPSQSFSSLLAPTRPGEWAELRELLRDEVSWLFRGVRDCTWQLKTSLELSAAGDADRRSTEASLLFRFQQAAANYLPIEQIPTSRIDWLASMQHHGAPTRLLDVTRSPYVAAYFAAEEASPGVGGQIWAFNEIWFHDRASEILSASTHGDSPLYRWLYHEADEDWPVRNLVAPAGTFRLSPRQVAQQAAFLVVGNPALTFEANLAAMFKPGDVVHEAVRRYEIPAAWRGEMLRDLRLMNISRASLFPGFDGFAQSLKYELVNEDLMSRARRVALRELKKFAQKSGEARDESNGEPEA